MVLYTRLTPSINQTNVARTTVVNFTMEDAYGVDINTLGVSIDGYQAIQNGGFVNNYNGRIYPSTGQYVVGIYPKSPDFIRGAAQIPVHIEVQEGATLDAYDYVFYTAGYDPPPPDPPVPPAPTRACLRGKPFFPPTDLGLVVAVDDGTGTEVTLQWKAAHPHDENNVVFYNIYSSTQREYVFDGYPDFLSADVDATIGGI
jgi:hypothetical protein